MKLFNLFKSKDLANSDINLPIFGNVKFEESSEPKYKYQSIKEDYNLDNDSLQIELLLKRINKQNIERISKILNELEKYHNKSKAEYLNRFVNGDIDKYINSLFREFLSENEYNLLTNSTDFEKQRLFAFKIILISIQEKFKGFVITFEYVFANHGVLSYKYNENQRLIKREGSNFEKLLREKQLPDFDKLTPATDSKYSDAKNISREYLHILSSETEFNNSDISKICSKFYHKWHTCFYRDPIIGYSIYIRSYFVYLMIQKAKAIIQTIK